MRLLFQYRFEIYTHKCFVFDFLNLPGDSHISHIKNSRLHNNFIIDCCFIVAFEQRILSGGYCLENFFLGDIVREILAGGFVRGYYESELPWIRDCFGVQLKFSRASFRYQIFHFILITRRVGQRFTVEEATIASAYDTMQYPVKFW